MRSPLFELQKALLLRLNTISCPAYDDVPYGADFPYVTIGEDTANDWSTKTNGGQVVTSTLHVWSEYKGMAEVKGIMDEVIQAITSGSLPLSGFNVAVSGLELNEVFRDPDGITRHGVLRFRFKIEEV